MAITLQPADSAAASISLQAQLDALLHGVSLAPLDSTGWIRVTGSDRVRWLNGMVTNNIADLKPGQGCYNFVLNAQGRIQGDLTAWLLEDSILLETSRDQIPALLTHLDHFIIMDDVELADITSERSGILIAGPNAPTHLKENRVELDALHMTRVRWRSAWVDAIHAYSSLVPHYELWSDPETISALSGTLAAIGAKFVSSDALEALRILSGTPRYGTDIRNTEKSHDLPQETAQTRALHFSKGCYLGQEIVERIRSRGNVHRTFSSFQLIGTLPEPGAALTAESFPRPVGELTSIAVIPLATGPVQLALGYIRREALDRNLTLEYPGGTAPPIALPYSLP
jgi:folate-binding protein YgfZ